MAGWAEIRAAVNRRRRGVIVALSALGHLALFALIGLQAPQLRQMALPDRPTFDLRLIPPVPTHRAAAPVAAQPTPVQPRPTPTPPKGVATLPLAPAPPGNPTGGGIGTKTAPAPLPAAPGSDLKTALRGFSPGCRMRDAVGLTKAERDACDEKLGRGAATAPFIPAPMDPAKRRAFDAQAAKDERYRKYKEGNVPPGITPGSEPGKNTGLGDDYAGVRR
jgi:hypothetical protein